MKSCIQASNKSESLQMSGWDLPADVFMLILDKLSSIEMRAMRLVCRGWRRDLDASLTQLTPRGLLQPQVMVDLIAKFGEITSLDCSYAPLAFYSEDQLRAIVNLTKLKHLSIVVKHQEEICSHRGEEEKVRGTLLANVARLTGLTRLELQAAGCFILQEPSGINFSVLRNLSSLASLDLKYDMEDNWSGLGSLSQLQSLKSLKLWGRQFRHEAIDAVAKMAYLTSLSLVDSDRWNEGISSIRTGAAYMSVITDLQELRIEDCADELQSWLAKHLKPLVQLTSLGIGERAIIEAGIRLGDLTRLKRLHFPIIDRHTNDFSVYEQENNILQLEKLSGLEYLSLGDVGLFKDKFISTIARMSNLHTVEVVGLDRYPAGGAVFQHLKELHMHVGIGLLPAHPWSYSLRSLTIMSCDTVPTTINQVLQSLSCLSSLDLSDSNYDEGQTAEFLLGLLNLKRLVLNCCGMVTAKNLDAVSMLLGLQHLDLQQVEVKLQASGLKRLTALTHLCLSSKAYTEEDMQSLIGLRQMRRLELCLNNDDKEGLKYLGSMTVLQSLHLSIQGVSKRDRWEINSKLKHLCWEHSLAAIYINNYTNVISRTISLMHQLEALGIQI